MHAGAELALHAANAGEAPPTAAELLEAMLEAFEGAIMRGQDEGATWEPDAVEAAMTKLELEDVERLERFAADERLRAVRWEGIELPFALQTQHRKWRGTLDAYGVGTRYVEKFAKQGRDWTSLYHAPSGSFISPPTVRLATG